jgi:GNAT superfamily N-acetyltransferase
MAAYVAAFLARCDAMRGTTSRLVDTPGIQGVVSHSADSPTRVLVSDDQGADVLASLMPSVRAGTISVFATAPRCTEIVASMGGWRGSAVTSMINRDLQTLPDISLPSGLTLRPVRRVANEPPTGVPLQDAVALAVVADPLGGSSANVLADHLRSMPPSIQLFAAVDVDGTVRATCGFGTFGEQATVIFVNTHPDWRRRGVGHAMTVAALRAARGAGAGQACLEASTIAVPIYQRLGFEIVAQTTQFFRAP